MSRGSCESGVSSGVRKAFRHISFDCEVVDIFVHGSAVVSGLCSPLPHLACCRSSFLRMRALTPSSAPRQRRFISRVKCLASWGEWITIRVSSLVCAAEGDQLKDPVITVRLSITATRWFPVIHQPYGLQNGFKRLQSLVSCCSNNCVRLVSLLKRPFPEQ